MKTWVLCEEPAEYTLDLVRRVYAPAGAHVAWRRGASRAAAEALAPGEAFAERSVFARFAAVWRALRDHDFVVVNGYSAPLHWFVILLDALFFRRRLGLDFDTQADAENYAERGGRAGWMRNRVLRWLCTRPWTVGLAGGTGSHTRFFLEHGMAAERVKLFPMVVDEERHRRRFAHPEDGVFRFGYLGRLEPHKRVDDALAAFAGIVGDGVKCEFHVIGEGSAETELKAKFGKIGGVRFLGALYGEEKTRALQQLDALVLVSAYEPWGLVVNEALQAGIPVIVGDRVGAREDLVQGGEPTGLVVPVRDIAALSQAMRRLRDDRDFHTLAAAAATRRMVNWNMSAAARAFDAITVSLPQC